MNIENISSALQAAVRPYMKYAGLLIAALFFVIIIFILFIRPASRRISTLRGELAARQETAALYRSFSGIKGSLAGKRAAINSALQPFAPLVNIGQNKDQAYLSELSRICKEKGIALERLTPSQEKNETIWRIQFKAAYADTVSFFAALENFFSITSLSVAGGGTTAVNNVEAVIMPLQMEIPAPAAAGTKGPDFMELHSKAVQTLAEIRQLSAVATVPEGMKHNPMFYRDTIFPVDKKGVVIHPPDISIDSIVWDNESPLVIVKGKILKSGDFIDDALILAIRENAITVRYKAHKFTIKYMKRELK